MRRASLAAALLAAVQLLAAAGPAFAAPQGAGKDRPTPGGDAGRTHHSLLADITPDNADRLGLAWLADLGTNRVLEATPVVVHGVMYAAGVAGRVYAFDGATGRPGESKTASAAIRSALETVRASQTARGTSWGGAEMARQTLSR